MTITIEGLNARQRVFADCMWRLNGRDQVRGFIASLPQEFQNEARTVLNMMLAAVFDQSEDVELAQQALDKFRK